MDQLEHEKLRWLKPLDEHKKNKKGIKVNFKNIFQVISCNRSYFDSFRNALAFIRAYLTTDLELLLNLV